MPPSPRISRLEMTPNGHAVTQYPQPLQTSSWITTVPNSVRKIAPVGQTSRQPACVQCLHTSDDMSHRTPSPPSLPATVCSTNATCRHVSALRPPVLSYDHASRSKPSVGTSFHSLHATSHALQPMHNVVSVKNPTRSCSPVIVTRRPPLRRVARTARRAAPGPHRAGGGQVGCRTSRP